MDPVKLVALIAGVFFLAFGLAAYRQFFKVLGVTAGLALWVVFREPLVRLPGLRDHPGTAALLILILFCAVGVLLVVKFRKIFAFLGGFGTGVLLSGMVTAFFRGDSLLAAESIFSHPAPMDLLAGLVAGAMFLLFERFFALFLTSSVGGVLCAWAIGGRWTFPVCLLIGLVAQPLIFLKVRPRGIGKGEKGKGDGGWGKGPDVLMILFAVLTLGLPGVSNADWVVERVAASSSRIVIGTGWRNGVRQGERYAVLDRDGRLVVDVTLSEVFSDAAYSEPVDREKVRLVEAGMRVQILEDYQYEKAITSGRESPLLEFMRVYPQSRHRADIFEALDEVRFRRTEMNPSRDAYALFQRQYPTSRFAAEAARREEKLAFDETRAVGSEDSFRDFLDRFPGTSRITGMPEVRRFLKARNTARVYAYRDFLTAYPNSPLAGEFRAPIEQFEGWADRLEYGPDPLRAVRYFGENGDETAVPLLVGKLTVPDLSDEAKKTILMIGKPALATLLEVLISPMQTRELTDRVAQIIGEMGDVSAVPAMRAYVDRVGTPAGRSALLMLEDRAGR